MPIFSPFNMALDARSSMGDGRARTSPSLRPVSPPKSSPFARFSLPFISSAPITVSSQSSSFSFPARISSPLHSSPLHSFHTHRSISSLINDPNVSASVPVPAHNIAPFSRFPPASSLPAHFSTLSNSSRVPPPHSRPASDSTANPTPFRPSVPASERLTTWSSPFSLCQRALLDTQLPPALVNKAYEAVQNALAENSKSTYAAGVKKFHSFCDAWSINEEARMPASPTLITAFAAEHCGLNSGNTIRTWLSGLRSWHILNQAPWHGDDAWVHLARVSANKSGTAHERPPRAPVSVEHLYTLRRHLNLSIPFHASIWAVALTTFFGCRRLGETTLKSAASFNPLYHVTRASEVHFRSHRDGATSADFHIPWTKTTKQAGAEVILTTRDDELCPIGALHNHLTVNKDAPPSMSMFTYRNADGTWSHMTRNTFLTFVTNIWQEAGLDHVSGHSFRIGGAVTLLLAGVPPEVVAATGSWTSLAFLLYWRRLGEIIPMSTSRAYSQSDLSSLHDILERFRICSNISASSLSL